MSYKALREAVHSPNVVFLVGTGVTIHATGDTNYTWSGMLTSLYDRVRPYLDEPTASRIRGQIHSGDPNQMIAAADEMVEAIGGQESPEMRIWLSEKFADLKSNDDSVIRALQNTSKLLLTTNYDSLLSTPELPPVTWKERDKVEQALSRRLKGVIHLHGHYSQPSSIVLGATSYEEIGGAEFSQAFQRAMGFSNSIVFLGCGAGLDDPNFGPFMDWASRIKASSSIPWFIVCRKGDLFSVKKKWPFVVPISYGEEYSELGPFVTALLEKDNAGSPKVKPGLAYNECESALKKSEMSCATLRGILSRVLLFESLSLNIARWEFEHLITESGDSVLRERQTVKANGNTVNFLRKRYGMHEVMKDSEEPDVMVYDGDNGPLRWADLEVSNSHREIVVLLEPPLKSGESADVLFRVRRPRSWQRLLKRNYETSKLVLRSFIPFVRVEFVAPKGRSWKGLRCAPQVGDIEIIDIDGQSRLRWTMRDVGAINLEYQISLHD